MSEQEKPKEPVKPVKEVNTKQAFDKIAVILVRGTINIKPDVKYTLTMMGLKKKNACIMINDTPSYRGMLNKIKDIATWGEIDGDTLKLLKEKRGKEGAEIFHLSPPRKGFGRKGVKQPFKLGGALGDRKDKINELIQRMV